MSSEQSTVERIGNALRPRYQKTVIDVFNLTNRKGLNAKPAMLLRPNGQSEEQSIVVCRPHVEGNGDPKIIRHIVREGTYSEDVVNPIRFEDVRPARNLGRLWFLGKVKVRTNSFAHHHSEIVTGLTIQRPTANLVEKTILRTRKKLED